MTALTGPHPTTAPASPTVRVRPQPVGIFPLPAGFLLVDGGPGCAEACAHLVAGRLPDDWPAALRALEHAHAGDTEAALAALTGDDPITRYNRFVLAPVGVSPAERAALRAALGDDLGALVDLVSFALGDTDEPPALDGQTGEVAALVFSAQATHLIDRWEPGAALRLLDDAVLAARDVSPVLAAQLLATAADLRRAAEGPSPAVIAALTAALTTLTRTDLAIGRAELHLALGSAYQELAADRPGTLAPAVEHYLSALRLVSADSAPELWAAAQVNLSSAYLAMPMTQASDQLRAAVAAQGLRAALTVYTREAHPARWASTQLNLANALVYSSSAHREQNLVEAVERYGEVIEARDRRTNPLGYARALSNQGNALAHLGDFDRARPALHEAWSIFEELGERDGVLTVRGVLDEIARQVALRRPA